MKIIDHHGSKKFDNELNKYKSGLIYSCLFPFLFWLVAYFIVIFFDSEKTFDLFIFIIWFIGDFLIFSSIYIYKKFAKYRLCLFDVVSKEIIQDTEDCSVYRIIEKNGKKYEVEEYYVWCEINPNEQILCVCRGFCKKPKIVAILPNGYKDEIE